MIRSGAALGSMVTVSLLLCSGCATPGQDLLATGIVSVAQPPAGKVGIADLSVHQDGETLIVEGRLSRPGGPKIPSVGRVEVTVMAPGGQSFGQKSLSGRWRACHGAAPFAVRMPLTAPKGSVVRVLYQDSDGDKTVGLRRPDNLGAPGQFADSQEDLAVQESEPKPEGARKIHQATRLRGAHIE